MTPLTIDHLLWRMGNVHAGSRVVNAVTDSNHTTRRFDEIATRAEQLAGGLHDVLKVGTGDVVVVVAFNTIEHIETLFAVPRLGAIVNSVNVRGSVEVLVHQALSPRPTAVIVDSSILEHPAVGDSARQVLQALYDVQVPVVTIGDREWSAIADRRVRFEDLVIGGSGAHIPEVGDENLTAFLFHSSGTTGTPKMYPVSHRAVVLHALCQSGADATGLTRSDTVMPLAPFFHVNAWGLPFTCAVTGASMVVAGGDGGARRLARIMHDEHVTVAAAVPTVWHDICGVVSDGAAPAPADLHTALTGGSGVQRALVDAVDAVLGARMINAWGMTETMACSTYERDDPCGSAGIPIPLVELRLDTRDFTDQRADIALGRLQVRGPFIVGAPDPGSGWFDTGDIASISGHGRLGLHDRDKDLVKSGGEWIASAELERHLCEHPAITGAVVVGVPNPRWSERPYAFVTVAEDYRGDLIHDLKNHVEERFPRWWVPDVFTVVDEFPLTSVGKVNKAGLRQQAALNYQKHSEAIA